MTTRAQDFRNNEARHGSKVPEPEVNAEKRYSHNDAARADASATHAIEPNQGVGAPSRKSTRGGSGRVKPDSALTNTTRAKANTPTTRNQRH